MVLRSDSQSTEKEKTDYLKNLLPRVFKTEGDWVEFDPKKIEDSIVRETELDRKNANKITEIVVRRIISSGIEFLSGPHIREIVCSVLSEQHFEDARKLYTRIGMPLMDYEAILKQGIKENANQDMNPESIHHWAANRISEEYALLRILDSKEAHAHLYGDIHVHMLRYFDLRPFCVDGSTKIPILNKQGILKYVQAKFFDKFFRQDEKFIELKNQNFFFYTPSGIQQLKYVSRKKAHEKLFKIVTSKGKEIILTKDHKVMVFNDNMGKEIPVNSLKIGDKIQILNSELIHKNLRSINLIDALLENCPKHLLENVYVKNLREKLLIEKNHYSFSWEDVFYKAEILDYPRSWETGNIPILQAINLINEYSIDLANIELGVMGSSNTLPADLPISPSLLKLVGYFLSEGNYNVQEGLSYNLVLSSKDKTILNDMRECIENSFDTYITQSFTTDKTPQISFGGKLIFLLFRYVFGIKSLSENKSLNDIFYNLSDKSLKYLLSGLYSGDGHIVYRPYKSDCSITYTSKSKSLIDYLSFILSTHDIRFSIKKDYYEYNIDEYHGEGLKYRIHVYGYKNLKRLYSLLEFKQQEKQVKFKRFLKNHHPTYSETDLPYEYIQEINPINPSHLYVYDFTLKGNGNWMQHTFFAENILIHNCQEWDPRMILENGLPPVDSWAHCSRSGPAGSLRVAVTHLAKWLGIIQGEFSGGQGYDYITTFLAPYARGLSEREIEQSMQCLIFETNQIFAARGGQVPFTSISCTPTVPKGLENISAVGPYGKTVGIYGDYKEECLKLFDALTDVYIGGDHNGKLFAFPKHEVKIKKEWLKEFEPSYLKVMKEAIEMGTPYFLNMCPEWMPDEIHSQCCRKFLHGDKIVSRCILDPEKRKKSSVWENYITIGSLQSVSLNLPRYAYMAHNEDEYFKILDEKMELCKRILIKKWHLMEKRLKTGHLPLCSGKINGEPLFKLEDQNLSIGFTGLNEAVKSLTGHELHEDDSAYKLGKKILEYMVGKCNTMSEDGIYDYSLWEQPSESTANRLAKLDLKHFPKKAIPQSSGNSAYYTNSSHFRYDADMPLYERIKKQGDYHPIVSGGVISHLWLGEQKPDVKALWELTKNICLNTNTAYFAYTTDYTYCPSCRKMFRGGKFTCPECSYPETKVYSRITGYYSEVNRYNPGKRAEWEARKREKIK